MVFVLVVGVVLFVGVRFLWKFSKIVRLLLLLLYFNLQTTTTQEFHTKQRGTTQQELDFSNHLFLWRNVYIHRKPRYVGCGMQQNIFTSYVSRPTIFRNKEALSNSFVPRKISHRDEEIRQMSCILAPILRGYQGSNVFVYGTCGTGKTICSRYVAAQLEEAGKGRVKCIYINAKLKRVADTEYRLLNQLLREFGELMPDTGLPTDALYRRLFALLEERKTSLVLMLDEIDALFKKIGDEFLYNLTRINTELKGTKVVLVGITNDLSFRDRLDQRIKSSLGEEEVLFKPYNAMQLKNILLERVNEGFIHSTVDPSAINKCAAIAAQEHGDARKALDLLRVAGELADRDSETTVTEAHVDMAERKLDIDRVAETIKSQPLHSQTILYSAIRCMEKRQESSNWADTRILTGDLFDAYSKACTANGTKVLTQRRFSDLVGELDMLGIISTKVISKGRYGRTREITLAINGSALEKAKTFLETRFR